MLFDIFYQRLWYLIKELKRMDINNNFFFFTQCACLGREYRWHVHDSVFEPFPEDSNYECGESVLPFKMKSTYVYRNIETNILLYRIFSQVSYLKFYDKHFFIDLWSSKGNFILVLFCSVFTFQIEVHRSFRKNIFITIKNIMTSIFNFLREDIWLL